MLFVGAGQWPIGAKIGDQVRGADTRVCRAETRLGALGGYPTSTRLAGGCFSPGIYTEPSSAFVVMANPMHILLRPKISPSPSAAIQEG